MSLQEEQSIFSIGAVANMLGIPTSTLRGWEDRYGLVTPNRSRGSQRIYTRSQVEQLRFIKEQIESGRSAADAHRLLSQQQSTGVGGMARIDARDERRILILLAERDPYAADLAEYFLRTEGYDVCIALDAAHARTLFAERSPDLVVIDLLLSGGAGFGLCAELSAKAVAPVLAVASMDDPDDALLAGAAAFLPKPLDPLKLVSTVRDLLGTSALVRSAQRVEASH